MIKKLIAVFTAIMLSFAALANDPPAKVAEVTSNDPVATAHPVPDNVTVEGTLDPSTEEATTPTKMAKLIAMGKERAALTRDWWAEFTAKWATLGAAEEETENLPKTDS